MNWLTVELNKHCPSWPVATERRQKTPGTGTKPLTQGIQKPHRSGPGRWGARHPSGYGKKLFCTGSPPDHRAQKAAMATGHEILKAAYYILRDKTPYREPQLRLEIN